MFESLSFERNIYIYIYIYYHTPFWEELLPRAPAPARPSAPKSWPEALVQIYIYIYIYVVIMIVLIIVTVVVVVVVVVVIISFSHWSGRDQEHSEHRVVDVELNHDMLAKPLLVRTFLGRGCSRLKTLWHASCMDTSAPCGKNNINKNSCDTIYYYIVWSRVPPELHTQVAREELRRQRQQSWDESIYHYITY